MSSLCSCGPFVNQAKIDAVSLQRCRSHASSGTSANNENIRPLRLEGAKLIRFDSHGEIMINDTLLLGFGFPSRNVNES